MFLYTVSWKWHWLLQAPLVILSICFVSVCQIVHGMATSCFQVGFANYSAMTLWRQPITAIWSSQTTLRSATRRHACDMFHHVQHKDTLRIIREVAQILEKLWETKDRKIWKMTRTPEKSKSYVLLKQWSDLLEYTIMTVFRSPISSHRLCWLLPSHWRRPAPSQTRPSAESLESNWWKWFVSSRRWLTDVAKPLGKIMGQSWSLKTSTYIMLIIGS